ncbi:hypothetical protein [Lentibacillus cibarius]|nr:hypothetical protein [Lentibacillus cibarius]
MEAKVGYADELLEAYDFLTFTKLSNLCPVDIRVGVGIVLGAGRIVQP